MGHNPDVAHTRCFIPCKVGVLPLAIGDHLLPLLTSLPILCIPGLDVDNFSQHYQVSMKVPNEILLPGPALHVLDCSDMYN
jgi:hypothetical protein